jgi:putative hemolysin
MPGWGPTEFLLLGLLLPLLAASAFFSGSETALFGMGEAQRLHFRRSGTLAGRAIDALLHDERMLLITVLLGNMVVNVLYFVISSVVMLRTSGNVLLDVLLAVATLLCLILTGEVLPKIVANSRREFVAPLIAPPLLTLHRVLGPLRLLIDGAVVAPLSRLTAPAAPPPPLALAELRALVEISGREGVIDLEEQRLLRDVMKLSRLRVRDVMTPRVRLRAISTEATRQEVIELARATLLTRLPVYDGDLDHVVGVLHVKSYLLSPPPGDLHGCMSPPRYVPEMATLEQLLEHFRRTHTKSAIVVDEYGGTAGLVALEDVVEEVVGDIVGGDETVVDPVRQIDDGCWHVSGAMSLHDWTEQFGVHIESRQISTVGGLVVDRLGRPARVGDVLEIDHLRLEVEAVERSRVERVAVSLRPEPAPGEATT